MIAHLLEVVVTAATGIMMFLLVVLFLERVTPFSIIRSIGLQMNPAVAVIVLSVIVGLAIILSATIPSAG
jgi:uncharacterized membrane protein YjfL (UPF0719 family)